MPFESFNEPANKTIPEQADRSVSLTGSAQHSLFDSSLFSDTAATAVALGTTKVAIGVADDTLTRSILTKLPSEQTPLQQWWVKNSDAAHRELFTKHTNELAPLIKELHVADAKIQSGKAGMLETAAVLERIQKPLSDALGRGQWNGGAPEAAGRAKLYAAEAQSLTRVINASDHAALYEIKAALSRDTVASLSPKNVGALLEYKSAIQSADSVAMGAARNKLGSIAEFMQETALRYKEINALPDPFHKTHNLNNELDARYIWRQERYLMEVRGKTTLIGSPHPQMDVASIGNYIGTAEEVAAGRKLFINESRAAIAALDYGYYRSKVEVQTNKMHQAQLNINARLNPAALPEFGAPGTNLYKAMGWAGLSTGAGYAVDSMFTAATGIEMVDQHGNHGARLAIDGALVPSIVMAELPMRYKAPLAVAAFATGRATTYFQTNESSSPQLSNLLQPTTSDTVLLSGAIMSPLSAKYKALAMGAAFTVGRAINYAYPTEALAGRK